jgi:hypothetical protein
VEFIMNKLFATTALALLVVAPAMAQTANQAVDCGKLFVQPAGDGELQDVVRWQCVVDRANAHRAALLARNSQPVAKPMDSGSATPVIERDASVNPAIRSDANTSHMADRQPSVGLDAAVNTPHRPYTRIEDYWQDK